MDVNRLIMLIHYRIRKAFKHWNSNVRNQNTSSSKVVLYKTLFSANQVLQGCLLHVRGLCEAASGSLSGEGVGKQTVSFS